jgi:molecular chaperone DnaK (HSP70)
VLSGALSEDAIVLTDVCPYSLSTEVLDDSGFIPHTYCDILIKRNTTLPASISKIYITASDNQSKVHISAYQGESEDPLENTLLNQFILGSIPKAKAGKEQISIRFEYDLNGILTVSAEVLSTGKSTSVTVDTANMSNEIDLSKWKDAKNSKKFRQLINKADRLIKLHDGDGLERVMAATDQLKKSLVLDWDDEISKSHKYELEREIKLFEMFGSRAYYEQEDDE